MNPSQRKNRTTHSGWYSWLFRTLIYPVHEKMFGRRTVKLLEFYNESQFWSPEILYEYRKTRILNLLRLASNNVTFYRQTFRKDEVDINSFENFADIPFLERKHLQDSLCSLRNHTYNGKAKIQATGGSSGTPVRFYTDTVRDSSTVAERIRAHRWFDIDIGDKEVVIWGSQVELGRQDLLRTLRDFAFRSKLIYAFNFNDDVIKQSINGILAFKPRKIYGYAQCIHMLAKYYFDHFPKTKCKKICDVVFTTAEPLFDYQRHDIEKAFGAKVAVEYGARDAGLIAHECPEGNMHINAESIYVEIIDENGNVLPAGETGEIVVTNFDTPSMPILRYRTGDMGMLLDEQCPCGVTLPLMKVVGGRMSDFLVGADDRKIHPLGAIYILREIESIRKFRIVQKKLNQIDLELSVSEKLNEEVSTEVQRKFDKLIGCPVKLSFMYKDRIETSASGKFRHVICNV